MTSTDIKDHIETRSRQKIMRTKQFGIELKRIFGASFSKRVNGFPSKVFEVYKLHDNDIATPESRATIELDDFEPF
jgi:hypothetical protein